MDPVLTFTLHGLMARPSIQSQYSSSSSTTSNPSRKGSLNKQDAPTSVTSPSMSSASPSGPSTASTPLTASPSSGAPQGPSSSTHGRSNSMTSSPLTPASLQSPFSHTPMSSFPFGNKAEHRHRPSPSDSTTNTGSTGSFFDDQPSLSRPSSRVDPNQIRRSRSGGRSPSISSANASNANVSTRSIPNPGKDGSPEIRMGYLSAMETIRYIGKDKAVDVALALRVLAPFCDLLHERLAWTTSSSPSSSVSGFRRGGPVQLPDADVVIVGKIDSVEAEPESASRTEKNRRAAILSAGLREEDLPPPERVAYGIIRDYTLLKMSRHSSGARGSLGRSSSSSSKMAGGGGANLPMLKPKEAAEVGVKLEALEESLASYGYLPLFDLVRWQCYLPPRLASPFHFAPVSPSHSSPYSHPHTISHSHSASGSVSSLSGHRSPITAANGPVISQNIMEAFDFGGGQQHRRRGSDGHASLSNGHSSASPRTPEKSRTYSSADSRPYTADSIGKTFKLKPFGMGSRSTRSRSNSAKDAKLPTHRSMSSIVDLASDDEEFGCPAPMPEEMQSDPREGEMEASPVIGALGNVPVNGVLRQGGLPPSSFKPLTHSASDGFYLPGSGSTSTSSLDESSASNFGSSYMSPRHRQVVLPAGPSTFRLPIARQESSTFGKGPQRSNSSPGLALADSDSEAMWSGTTNSPANDPRNPFDTLTDGAQTPPDLSVPPRARRRELLIAAGLTPAPEPETGHATPVSTAPLSPPPLPQAPMPTSFIASALPVTGVRRPRNRAGSDGSTRSNMAEGDKEARRRAIIVLDHVDNDQESPSSLDSGRTYNGEGAVDLIRSLATLGLEDDSSSVGLAVSTEDSSHFARPGRIKTAEQMLAALTSRRSSLGPNEVEPSILPAGAPLPQSGANMHLASAPSTMALRRLSDLLEEEDGEDGEVGLHRHFREEAARRHTAGTQASNESHFTTSPSMTTDSSSNRNSTQFSSGSHEYGETSPGSGFPQTPQHPIGFTSAYGREDDGVEAAKQMLYEVFGDTWDDGSDQDDLTEVYGRVAQDQASRGFGHGVIAKKSGSAESAAYGKGRPESMAYPAWV